MPDTKPKLMWHADAGGKCHAGCEAWGHVVAGVQGCFLMDLISWEVFHAPTPANGLTCPFAVLADVLCAAKPHEEKPDEDRRCGTCALSSKPEDCAWIQSTTRPDGPPWPDCRFWRKR